MQNRLAPIGEKIRNSGAILQAGVWLSLLCVVAVFLSVRDYYTSMLGISSMPVAIDQTAVGFELWLQQAQNWVVAFLPQGVAWLGTFIFLIMQPDTEAEKRIRYLAAGIAVVAHVVDIYTGYIYYIHPIAEHIVPFTAGHLQGSPEVQAAINSALFHSAVADTIGSEILTSVCFGLLMVLWPDFMREIGKLQGSNEAKRTRPKPSRENGRR